ncbi:tetratricopeptide (TPR) repeat protein [Haloferula luteola]|uniref:Tetratricopeptide (TPR) repeat protein n=1 Tax=Haloferula luteola TaxID=595692 RepID=A0A840UWQ2_9BACT|nr:hypothetical protein [Haloferula luteola]MBB5350587.1 tetratricopeptide (TPR) repeat protein [Haloferula luteola]
MRFAWMACLMVGAVVAEEVPAMPEVAALIAPQVAALPDPAPPAVKGGVKMTITALNREVQQAVCDGLTCLHAGWDFEAYRHFVKALEGDPDCLMAHWGVGLALLHGSDDFSEEREAALNRILGLVDRGVGTDLEHRYVFGLTKLIQEGAREASAVFASAAEEYPNDPQLGLLQALLGRGGYDIMGDVTPDQERSEAVVRELIVKHPELSYLRYALLAMRAEAPDLEKDLEMARGLTMESPEFPPYFHLLGHFEWRSGHHQEAQQAFGWAADAYSEWMESTGLGALDCPGWTKAESYRAVALASKGDYETALAAAKALAGVKVPVDRATSDGARMLLWEGKTLPARILMRRGRQEDLEEARKLLPSVEETKGLRDHTLAVWSFQAFSTAVGAQLAMQQGDQEAAGVLVQDFTRLGSTFVETRQVAAARGEQSHWIRCFHAMEEMSGELTGLLAMSGPEGSRGSAYNWFLSARDHQRRASVMMPPMVLTPMGVRLSDYLSSEEKWDKALEALETGLTSYPNDVELLQRLVTVAEKADQPERSAEAQAILKGLAGS